MTTIIFRYDENEKETLRKEGEALGYKSLSDYMVAIVKARTKAPSPRKNKKLAPVGKRGKRAETRVTPAEKKRLAEYCSSEGETESAVLLRQVRILLTQEPHFTKEEIKALRMATTQLTAIGRNLNQIVAQINSGKISDSKLSQHYIGQLKQYIDNQAKAIRELIQKTKDRVIN